MISPQEISTQITRLRTQYGAQAYSGERAELIAGVVKDQAPDWLKRTVDRFIGELKMPPLVPEFREAVAAERERSWQIARRSEAGDAKKFFAGQINLPDDERKPLFDAIRMRVARGIGDPEWTGFMKHLKKLPEVLAPNSPRTCECCQNSGLVLVRPTKDGDPEAIRCFCMEGGRRRESFPRLNSHTACQALEEGRIA